MPTTKKTPKPRKPRPLLNYYVDPTNDQAYLWAWFWQDGTRQEAYIRWPKWGTHFTALTFPG